MSSQWTNKYAIMRDLSLAQGCVPVDIQGTICAQDKPPALDFTEETEESFYQNWVADGDFHPPDLELIKSMLDMVRGSDGSSDIEDVCPNLISITKPMDLPKSDYPPSRNEKSLKIGKQPENIQPEAGDCENEEPITGVPKLGAPDLKNGRNVTNKPESSEMIFIPNKPKLVTNTDVPQFETNCPLPKIIYKKKPTKNVAMASFLESIGVDQSLKLNVDKKENLKTNTENTIVLMKPTDFKVTNDELTQMQEQPNIGTFEKVAKWLENTSGNKRVPVAKSEQTQQKLSRMELLSINPSAMFKKKSLYPTSPSPATCGTPKPKRTPNKIESYKPSEQAEKYYRMYTERINMQIMLNEDVWARAERQMKEIDARRNLELLKSASSEASPTPSGEPSSSEIVEPSEVKADDEILVLDAVRLPQHRHLLTGDCVVCQVLCGTERSGARTIDGLSSSPPVISLVSTVAYSVAPPTSKS